MMNDKKIEIMDTTLRDGEQTNNVSFSSTEKLHLARLLLDSVKVDRIEIASALVSEGEKEAVTRIVQWAKTKEYLHKVEILGYADIKKSVDWIAACGATSMNLLTKGSLKHLEHQLRISPQEHLKRIEKTIEYAKSNGLQVNVYLEDWSNGYMDSPDYTFAHLDAITKLPVERVLLPDTLGILYPDQVRDAVNNHVTRYPNTHFDFHAHNDYGLGTINTLEAIKAGANGAHVTVNCLGERTGNASLAEVVAGLHDHLFIKTTVVEKKLQLVSNMVESFSGKRLAANKPIVGEDAFTQTAGIHADGDKKAGLYESDLLPERFGRKRVYALGKMSGKASIEQNLKDLGLELTKENLQKVLNRVKALADKKKSVTAEDLPFIISDVLELTSEFKLCFEHVVITSGMDLLPMCSLKIKYNDRSFRLSGSGDGGYDAFMNSIRSWAEEQNIVLPKLIDYEVRIPPGGRTSALVECKIIWEKTEGVSLTTRGVDPDQTIAAVQATEKMLNLVLD